MKKKILLMSLLALTTFSTTLFAKHNRSDLKINTKISSVNWVGKKVSGEHTGVINIKNGTLNLDDGHLASGKIVIDMSSITCSDLEGKKSQKLVGHLNSADFFDVDNHQTSTLEITGVKNIEGNKHMISGTLTIKGITKPITFPATIEIEDGKLGAYAEVKVDRTLYDIKYGSGKFFEGLGNKMINDEFIIKFKIAAK